MRALREPLPALLLTLLPMLLLVSCNDTLATAEIVVGGEVITVEVARSVEEQRRGLMNRRSLGAREGMLFVYRNDRRLTFWMKNTLIPLSIAFITSDGTIVQIEDMEPLSRAPVSSVRSVRYALEVNRGLFDELGVGVGDTVELPEDLTGSRLPPDSRTALETARAPASLPRS